MDSNNETIHDSYYIIYNLIIFLDFTEFQTAKDYPPFNYSFITVVLFFFLFFSALEYEKCVNLNFNVIKIWGTKYFHQYAKANKQKAFAIVSRYKLP